MQNQEIKNQVISATQNDNQVFILSHSMLGTEWTTSINQAKRYTTTEAKKISKRLKVSGVKTQLLSV